MKNNNLNKKKIAGTVKNEFITFSGDTFGKEDKFNPIS